MLLHICQILIITSQVNICVLKQFQNHMMAKPCKILNKTVICVKLIQSYSNTNHCLLRIYSRHMLIDNLNTTGNHDSFISLLKRN